MGTQPAETWRTRRATPWLGHAVAGGGGALVGIGVLAIGYDVAPEATEDPAWVGVWLSVALIVVSYVVMPLVPVAARDACTAGVAIGIPGALAFFVFPGAEQFADFRPFFLVAIVAWLLAFVVRPTRGRVVLLGLALAFLFVWALGEVADVSPAGYYFESIGAYGDAPEPNWGEMGAVCMGFAIAYLLGVVLLDRRGDSGLATAAVVPGVSALALGVVFLGVEWENLVVAGLLSVTAGLFCGAAGTVGHRRFTVWSGAFFATVGALLLTGKIAETTTRGAEGDKAGTIFGASTIGFGIVMTGVALLVARLLREPAGDDHGEAPAPPP